MNTTGVGAGMGIALPQAEQAYQNLVAGRQRIQEAIRRQQASEAFFKSLFTPGAGAVPQQGPPGFAAMQPQANAAPPASPAGPGASGGPPPMGGGAAASPAPGASGPAPPAGGVPSQPPGTAAGGVQIPDPLARLKQMAQALKAQNPGADNATLAVALEQQVSMLRGLAPEDRALMQAQLGLLNAQQRYYAAQERDVTQRRGQDIRSADTQRGQNMAMDRTQALIAARQSLEGGQPLPDNVRTFMAQALLVGDNQTIQLALGFTKNRPALISQIVQRAQELDPSFTGERAAQAIAQFGGMKTAAGTVGRTAGNVAVGAAELPQISAQIDEVSKHVNLSQFPSINAIRQSVTRQMGPPEQQQWLQKFLSYVQTARNAYQQIAARGGRISDKVRGYGEELINGTMAPGTLKGALDAFSTEAGIVKGATGQAMKDVTGGGAPSGPPPVPASDYPNQTLQGPDNSTWTSDGTTWTQQRR